MNGRYLAPLLACALVALAACNDQTAPTPQAPSFASSSGGTCDFRLTTRQANRYFSAQEAKVVRGLLTAMETAGAFTTAARDRGFDVMTHIASNIDAGNPDFQTASDLTNSLLGCMFDNPADLPATYPEDFTVAADPARHGGYQVRGGPSDPASAPVFSRPLDAPFSGIAPPGSVTWPGVLGGNPAPARILAYGRPGSTSFTYDWKIAPRSTAFSPPVEVGVCVDAAANATSLLDEEHVGLLPFVDAAFLDPAFCSPTASRPSWPATFANSVFELFAPRNVWAKPLPPILNPGGLGGTTGGIGSEFGPQVVSFVTLTFVVQPSDVAAGQIITPAVVVRATAEGTGETIPNVTITLSSKDNNGTPALLSGTLTQVTGADGTATFADLSQIKPGGYLLVANGSVNGRPAIGVPAVESARFNVRP